MIDHYRGKTRKGFPRSHFKSGLLTVPHCHQQGDPAVRLINNHTAPEGSKDATEPEQHDSIVRAKSPEVVPLPGGEDPEHMLSELYDSDKEFGQGIEPDGQRGLPVPDKVEPEFEDEERLGGDFEGKHFFSSSL